MIKGGYYIKARCIQNSDISKTAPHIREIWDWILKEANHRDTNTCKRGQCVRSYKDIIDGLCWYVGWRKMSYSKSDCENAMKWLKKHTMITTTKTTRGMIITIVNYDKYQNPDNYESHTETNRKATREPQTCHTINKNDKNVKNDKNKSLLEQIQNCKTTNKYSKKMKTDFYLYWIEKNNQGIEKWKKEYFWDIDNRLLRWKRKAEDIEYQNSQRNQFKNTTDEQLSSKRFNEKKTSHVDDGFVPISEIYKNNNNQNE